MDAAPLAREFSEIWLRHLLDCAREAQSCAIPFTDIFGLGAFERCMKTKGDTIKDKMKNAGISPVVAPGIIEVVYHARDVAEVFGSG